MPRYAFGTWDGHAGADLFWVQDHPTDRAAGDAAIEYLAEAFPEFEIRRARTYDDECDCKQIVLRVSDDFPLDATEVSTVDNELVEDLYQGSRE